MTTTIESTLDATLPAGFRYRIKGTAPYGEWQYVHHREPTAPELEMYEVQAVVAVPSALPAKCPQASTLAEGKTALDKASPIIRAAYEVLLGCIYTPSIAAQLDIATVESIAKKLNGLLPDHRQDPSPEAKLIDKGVSTSSLIQAMRSADWSGVCIGNKAILNLAAERLQELDSRANGAS